jgi:hypothetical protein
VNPIIFFQEYRDYKKYDGLSLTEKVLFWLEFPGYYISCVQDARS